MPNFENDLKFKNVSSLQTWKHLILFVIGLAGLVIAEVTVQLIVDISAGAIYGVSSDAFEEFVKSPTHTMLVSGIAYVALFGAFVLVLRDDLKEITKSFKGWKPFVAGLVGLGLIIAFNNVYVLFLKLINVDIVDNNNEDTINSITTVFPILTLVIFANIGPICEELTYRVGLFSLIRKKNRCLAYVVTILVFAFIHFNFGAISDGTIVNELLNLPLYLFSGFMFTFLYEKFGLAGSATAHILNNTISMCLTIMGK